VRRADNLTTMCRLRILIFVEIRVYRNQKGIDGRHTARMEGNSYFLVNPDDTTQPIILPRVFGNTVDSHFSTCEKRNLLSRCDTVGFLKTLID
jgi:hypothetical protein